MKSEIKAKASRGTRLTFTNNAISRVKTFGMHVLVNEKQYFYSFWKIFLKYLVGLF